MKRVFLAFTVVLAVFAGAAAPAKAEPIACAGDRDCGAQIHAD
ncbi:hypothetical protein [Mesorhizobium sp. M0802]